MTFRRLRVLLCLFIAISIAGIAPVPALMAWYCEGRVCGTTFENCCCASSSGQDTQCANATKSSAAPDSLCASGCGCEMVITGGDDNAPGALTAAFVLPVSFFATLPHVAPIPTPEFVPVAVIHSVAPRGPPAASAVCVVPSLRAPPVS